MLFLKAISLHHYVILEKQQVFNISEIKRTIKHIQHTLTEYLQNADNTYSKNLKNFSDLIFMIV